MSEVPAEMVGKARQFINDIDKDATVLNTILQGALKDLKARQMRGKVAPRPEFVIDLKRKCDNAKLMSVASCWIDLKKKYPEFYVAFINTGTLSDESWRFDEPIIALSFAVMNYGNYPNIEGDRPAYRFVTYEIAWIGLHALARRFQRGFETSRANIGADFNPLVKWYFNDRADVLDPENIHIQAKTGTWRGRMEDHFYTLDTGLTVKMPVLSIRTFV
jgi:hypothetical protein